MHAQRQSVAGGLDRFDDLVELTRLPAHDMQDRTEMLAVELCDAVQRDDMGGHEGAAQRGRFAGPDDAAELAHRLDMAIEPLLGGGVDDRADMGLDPAGIAELQFAAGAGDHLDHLVGDVLLHHEQAQGRAALAGGAEGRHHDVVGDLLGQRRRIDDHGVEAAGLGDQRDDRPVLGGESAVDRAGGGGRAGEGDAGDSGMRDQRRAERAVSGVRCKAETGTPASCSRRTATAAIKGVWGAGLATTLLPATSAAATCPAKMASGKFHGAMQRNGPRPRRIRRFSSPVGPGRAVGVANLASASAA
jgi:hypothetical protein